MFSNYQVPFWCPLNSYSNTPQHTRSAGFRALKYSWVKASNGTIPSGALKAGNEANGSPLFIARATYGNGIHLGKIGYGVGAAYIPWDGREIAVKDYEVLVTANNNFKWISSSGGKVPSGAVAFGVQDNGAPLFVARASYGNGIHPGKLTPGAAYIPWDGREIIVNNYEVLSV